MNIGIIKREVNRLLKKEAKDQNKSVNEILSWLEETKESLIELNKESIGYCEEVEQLISSHNPDLKRLSLLTSNLDCLLFQRILVKRKYVRNLFLKADSFLKNKGVNFLVEAIEREGWVPYNPEIHGPKRI